MDETNYRAIAEFANGDGSMRVEAIEAFRKEMRRIQGFSSIEKSLIMREPAFDFMREIDNPCPDLALRSMAREKLLAEAEKKGFITSRPPPDPQVRGHFHKRRRPPNLKVAKTLRGRR